MTQTVPATAILGPGKTGLAIGLRVLNIDGTEYAAFSAVGVAETSTLGTYRKASGVTVPDAGAYIVWGIVGTDYAEATVDSVSVLIRGTKTTIDALADLTAQNVADALKLAPTAGAPAAGSVNAHLDSLIASGVGAGTGTYTDTVTDGSDPIDGVRVQLCSDAGLTTPKYQAYTDASGVFTMYPDPGTYYRKMEKSGYTFTQGTQVVVT